MDSESEINLMKRRVVLHLTMGYGMNLEMKEKIKMVASKELHIKSLMEEKKKEAKGKKDDENEAMYEFFYNLEEYRQLGPEEEKYLREDGLLDAFNDSKGANLGGYIRDHIKKNNWRMKSA